ncbi:MAG: nuclear transport factor 2 family protein [Planctomycetota bacterium]
MTPKSVKDLAQDQLEAYNKGDITAFLKPYAPEVEAYDLGKNELLFKGLEAMAQRYAPYFQANPNLHCELVGRLVMEPYCIDQELVTGFAKGGSIRAVAIYLADAGLIRKIWFLKG